MGPAGVGIGSGAFRPVGPRGAGFLCAGAHAASHAGATLSSASHTGATLSSASHAGATLSSASHAGATLGAGATTFSGAETLRGVFRGVEALAHGAVFGVSHGGRSATTAPLAHGRSAAFALALAESFSAPGATRSGAGSAPFGSFKAQWAFFGSVQALSTGSRSARSAPQAHGRSAAFALALTESSLPGAGSAAFALAFLELGLAGAEATCLAGTFHLALAGAEATCLAGTFHLALAAAQAFPATLGAFRRGALAVGGGAQGHSQSDDSR